MSEDTECQAQETSGKPEPQDSQQTLPESANELRRKVDALLQGGPEL